MASGSALSFVGNRVRQRLGKKKVEKLKQKTGLDIVGVLVRGNTEHRKDLCLRDGTITCLFPDGEMFKSTTRHNLED